MDLIIVQGLLFACGTDLSLNITKSYYLQCYHAIKDHVYSREYVMKPEMQEKIKAQIKSS